MCCGKTIANDIQQAQKVRLLDMFIIGPVLIAAALVPRLSMPMRILLGIIGIGTILYNGYFYFKYKP